MSNLTKILQNNFDVSYYQHLIVAGELADCMNSKVYLVGGAVRDVLLGKSVNDIDLIDFESNFTWFSFLIIPK